MKNYKKYLKENGYENVTNMPEEMFEAFAKDRMTLLRMDTFFKITNHPYSVFEVYDFNANAKKRYFVSKEMVRSLLRK